MERIQNIPRDQQLKILESMTCYVAVQFDLFLKTSTYYVKKDTVFDGNCGLQAIKVATQSELDLASLRAKMVILIASYYQFIISTGLNIEYGLIAIECEYGSIPEQVTKEFATNGKWLSADCIKLLMINLGYDFKNIEHCYVENYKKWELYTSLP